MENAVTQFYLADCRKFSIGEVITKGDEEGQACILATESMDECIFLDGCGFVYSIAGKPCRHKFFQDISGTRQMLFGQYREVFLTEQYPLSIHGFDAVTILEEIPLNRFFGPNGAQVAHVVTWIRSKFRDDGENLIPETGFMEILGQVDQYAKDRLRDQTVFPVPLNFGLSGRGMSGRFASEPSSRLWSKARRFARAWAAAYRAAHRSQRLYRCKWLDSIPLIALTLRDVLLSDDFTELYAALEPFYPIAALDSEVPATLSSSS